MVNKQPQQVSDRSTEKPEVKAAVLKSITSYLHKNGLPKTLKRFLKEAKIESDDWKTTSVDLEDIYARYAVDSRNSDVKIKDSLHEDDTAEKDLSGLCTAEETSSRKEKKKKKKKKKNGVQQSSELKSLRKEGNISSEPRTVNAFQNLNIEQIIFADEMMQRNSHYWVKDGSEYGYGPKAREVFSQLKGNGNFEVKIKDSLSEDETAEKYVWGVCTAEETSSKEKEKKVEESIENDVPATSASNDGEEEPVEDLVSKVSKRRKIGEVVDHHTEKK